MMHDGQNQLKCTQLNTQQAGRQHDRPELVLSSLCGGKYFVSRINFRPHQGLKENFPRENLKLTRSSKIECVLRTVVWPNDILDFDVFRKSLLQCEELFRTISIIIAMLTFSI